MTKFRSKPVVIDAALFDGSLVGEGVQVGQSAEWRVTPLTCPDWFPAIGPDLDEEPAVVPPGEVVGYGDHIYIGTLEGTMRADPGDWIIKGLRGELYPCKPDVFHAKYERV
jgi:hypothetical protein